MIIRNALIGAAFVLVLAQSSALACTAEPVKPLSLKMRNLDHQDHNLPILIEIDGLTTMGSAEGDSCALVPDLPGDIFAITVEVVHADTGKPIGFEGFKTNPRAAIGFCAQASHRCQSFTSTVGKAGIAPGLPVLIRIEAVATKEMDARAFMALGRTLVSQMTLVAGGVDGQGRPYGHATIGLPSTVEVFFKQ